MPLRIFVRFFLYALKISSASFCGATSVILKGGKVDTKPLMSTSSMPRCDEQDFCSLSANLDDLALEDPCPKTEKYLEAHFMCHSLIDGPPVQGWSSEGHSLTRSSEESDSRQLKIRQINIVDNSVR